MLALFLNVQAAYFPMNIITLNLLNHTLILCEIYYYDRLTINYLNIDIFDRLIPICQEVRELIQILLNRDG